MDIHYTFKKYEEAYPLLLNDFLSEYEDNSELDFLKIQLDRYTFYRKNATLVEYSPGQDPLPLSELEGYSAVTEISDKIMLLDEKGNRVYNYGAADKLYRSFKKITDFITSKINEFEKEDSLTTVDIQAEYNEIDLSDSNGTEKIIMLYKLGVLDFLKSQSPFNVSTNSLASAISGITGINLTTVQSYLNPIYSKGTGQKNNPLESKKTLKKVENKLLNIGFNPLK